MKYKSRFIPITLVAGATLCVSAASFVSYSNNLSISKANQASTTTITEPKDLAELQAADPNEIAKLPSYDSRKYNIVPPVKDQHSEGICWAYAGSAVAETNALRLGVAKDKMKTQFSPNYMDYATKKRDSSWNIMDINRNDILTRSLFSAGQANYCEQTYSVWGAPCYASEYHSNTYVPPPFKMVESDFFMDEHDPDAFMPSFTPEHQKRRVANVKLGIAKYGALTFDTSVDVRAEERHPEYYYNLHESNKKSGHALTVVGWKDDIPASQFGPTQPKGPGGWLIKDSWGAGSHGSMEGYFWMSYESSFGSCIGYKFVEPDKYHNNYHWDVGEPYNDNDNNSNFFAKNENAAIFPVLKANYDTEEYLKAVNVTVVGKDVTLEVEVYNNVTGVDRLDPNREGIDPRHGKFVKKLTQKYQFGGTKTIELPTPEKLEKGQYFSIIAKVSNPTNDALISLATDPSKDDMTYSNVNGTWVNEHKNKINGAAVARIRAYTNEKKIPGATSTSLADATVKLDKTKVRFGDKNLPVPIEVKIGNTVLTKNDYNISYDPSKFYSDGGKVWSDDEFIGYGFVTLTGKNGYNGQITTSFDIIVGLAPDLGENGWYTRENGTGSLRVANIRIQDGWRTYNDIVLPEGFHWTGGSSSSTINKTSPLTLEYTGNGSLYYRYTSFNPAYGRLKLLDSSAVKPDTDAEVAPSPAPGPSPSPQPDGPLDAEHDFTKGKITFIDGDRYRHTGSEIKPKIRVTIPGNPVNPVYETDKREVNATVTYEHNVDVGVATVKVVGDFEHTVYWGTLTATFVIYDDAHPNPEINPVPPTPSEPKPDPVLPPKPEPEPSPSTPQLELNNVSIILNPDRFDPGEWIFVSVKTDPEEIAKKADIRWEIDGISKKWTGQNISFPAETWLNNKELVVTVTHNNVTRTDRKILKINASQKTPVEWDNNLTVIILSSVGGVLALLSIVLIVAKVKKWRIKDE